MIKQNEIIKVENYLNLEIQEEKLNSDDIAAFGYFDQALTALSAKSEENLLFLLQVLLEFLQEYQVQVLLLCFL